MAEVEMTEEEYKRELAFSHHGGSAAAWEDAAEQVKTEAGKAFIAGRDSLAEYLRILGGEHAKEGERERKKQQEYSDV